MTLRIGVVGCGMWGQKYVRVFDELLESQIVAVCDQDETRLKIIRQRYPQVDLFTNYKELLAHGTVDAVVVATQATLHYGVTRAALLAGKHVLVEKPFVLENHEGQELIELAERNQLTLMVGHVFLYNSGIRKLKQYLGNGANGIGDIYYLYATRTSLGPIRNDVNVVWDLATHDISIFSYLLNEQPHHVSAKAAKVLRNCREDVAFITLTYPNGVIANVHVSWTDPNRVREVVIVGSQKRVVFDDIEILEKVRVYEKAVVCSGTDTESFGQFVLSMRDGDIISPKVETSEPLQNQCNHFIDCIQQGVTPLTDGQNGLEVVKVINAIQESIRNDGTNVEVPR